MNSIKKRKFDSVVRLLCSWLALCALLSRAWGALADGTPAAGRAEHADGAAAQERADAVLAASSHRGQDASVAHADADSDAHDARPNPDVKSSIGSFSGLLDVVLNLGGSPGPELGVGAPTPGQTAAAAAGLQPGPDTGMSDLASSASHAGSGAGAGAVASTSAPPEGEAAGGLSAQAQPAETTPQQQQALEAPPLLPPLAVDQPKAPSQPAASQEPPAAAPAARQAQEPSSSMLAATQHSTTASATAATPPAASPPAAASPPTVVAPHVPAASPPPPPDRRLLNLAAAADGASVLAANPEARRPERAFDGDVDSFVKNDCAARKWLMLELSQLGTVESVQLTMKELYSSRVQGFRVYGRQTHPRRDNLGPDLGATLASSAWELLGSLVAENKRGSQSFELPTKARVRYLLLMLDSHYGTEAMCALNTVEVLGVSAAQELEEALLQGEEEEQEQLLLQLQLDKQQEQLQQEHARVADLAAAAAAAGAQADLAGAADSGAESVPGRAQAGQPAAAQQGSSGDGGAAAQDGGGSSTRQAAAGQAQGPPARQQGGDTSVVGAAAGAASPAGAPHAVDAVAEPAAADADGRDGQAAAGNSNNNNSGAGEPGSARPAAAAGSSAGSAAAVAAAQSSGGTAAAGACDAAADGGQNQCAGQASGPHSGSVGEHDTQPGPAGQQQQQQQGQQQQRPQGEASAASGDDHMAAAPSSSPAAAQATPAPSTGGTAEASVAPGGGTSAAHEGAAPPQGQAATAAAAGDVGTHAVPSDAASAQQQQQHQQGAGSLGAAASAPVASVLDGGGVRGGSGSKAKSGGGSLFDVIKAEMVQLRLEQTRSAKRLDALAARNSELEADVARLAAQNREMQVALHSLAGGIRDLVRQQVADVLGERARAMASAAAARSAGGPTRLCSPPESRLRRSRPLRLAAITAILCGTLVAGLVAALHPKSTLLLHPLVRRVVAVLAVVNGVLAAVIGAFAMGLVSSLASVPLVQQEELVIVPGHRMLSNTSWSN